MKRIHTRPNVRAKRGGSRRAAILVAAGCLATLCATVDAAEPKATGSEILLDRQTNVEIIERGPFGNAQGRLRDLLQKYLLLALGKQGPAGPGETVTFVIESGAETWEQIPRAEIRDLADVDAVQIDVSRDPQPTVRIRGATVVAAGLGVMRFLEEHLGVFWVMPGELGLCLPGQKAFRLATASKRITPAFVSRVMTGFALRDDFVEGPRPSSQSRTGLLHKGRGFFYGHDYFKSLGLNGRASPSHNMIRIFPPELKQTHPEVFPIIDGRRWFPPERPKTRGKAGGAWQAWHPCYSDPHSVQIAVQKAELVFAEGKYCFSLGVNDGRKTPCQCDACREAGFPQSYYRFVSRVAEALKGYYPPRLVGLIAYGDVKDPPPDLVLPENVLVMVVGGGPESVLRWAGHAKILGIYEHFAGQGFWVPNLPLAGMKSNARFFQQHGIRFYRAEAYPVWAFDAPRVYLASRLLWDPDLDLDAALRRFCRAAFAEGGEPMVRLYQRWAALRDGDVLQGGVTPMLGRPPNKLWLDPVRQLSACSAADFDYVGRCIAEARSLVADERARRRIEMVATFFEDSRTLFDMLRLAREAFDADRTSVGSDAARARIAEALRLRQKRCELLEMMKGHPEWFAGTKAMEGDQLVYASEQRATVSMMRMNLNGVIADVFRLGQEHAPAADVPQPYRQFLAPSHTEPVKMYFNRRHARYSDPRQYVPLDVTPDGRGVQFRASAAAGPWSDHPSWMGARKVHWMAGGVRDAKSGGGNLHLIDVDASGRQGRLVVRLMTTGSRGSRSIGRDAMLLEDFGSDGRPIHRRIAVVGGDFDPDGAKTVPTGEPRGSIKIYVEWEPLADESSLEGTCRVMHVEFQPAGDSP